MTDKRADQSFPSDRDFARQVTAKAARKLLAGGLGREVTCRAKSLSDGKD